MLNASQRRVNKNSLTWWYVLKTSWRCLEDVFARRLEDVLKTSWRRLGKTSWKRLEDVLKTYGQDEYIGLDQDVLKTSSDDVWLRQIYSSWSRRLNLFWRRLLKTKTKDVLKTSSRCLHQDVCLVGRDIRNLLEYEEDENSYKPVRVGNFCNNDNIKYESNSDRNKTLWVEEYLNKIWPYFKGFINNLKKSGTWKIQ